MTTRVSGIWTGEQAVELIRMVINDRRADSLEFRMENENLLAEHALRRPWFGWGGWGRNFVTDRYGRSITTVDGMWIIALGTNGLIGLISFESALLLPMVIARQALPGPYLADSNAGPGRSARDCWPTSIRSTALRMRWSIRSITLLSEE